MNYTTLTGLVTVEGSIKYWQNYSRLDAAGILAEAEAWIYSRLRVREMIAAADVAIASTATSAAYPTGYLDPIHFGIPGYMNELKFIDQHRFRSGLGWDTDAAYPSAMPTRYTDIGGQFEFNTAADAAYTGKMVFYKTPTALSGSNETNFLTDKYPTLLRRVCKIFSSEARKEFDVMDRSELMAGAQIEEIKKESDLHMRGMELDFNWEGNA